MGGGPHSAWEHDALCSQVSLRQLLRRLERERGEVEWQLRDWEWRLDQEATVRHALSCLYIVVELKLNYWTMLFE